jgi:hypothetical protein
MKADDKDTLFKDVPMLSKVVDNHVLTSGLYKKDLVDGLTFKTMDNQGSNWFNFTFVSINAPE